MPAKPSGIAPHFLVTDVVRAAEYYRDRLGFEIGRYFGNPPVFVIVQRDGMGIQLSRMDGSRGGSNRKWKGEGIDAYLWVRDVASLHRQFASNKATILEGPILREYGMKELDVQDVDGYVLRFGEDVPASG